jgi:TetR/AcrR family transcriptional regulator, tetracycline repressor protein
MQLLDSEGVDRLSMRQLAAALGTVSSTLYWHVRDKDELLLLILDEALRDVTVPADGDWDARLLETLVRCYEALRPRPALVDVLWRAAWDLGPEALRVADSLTGLVAQSGLPDAEVGDCYLGLITLLYGFVAGAQAPAGPGYRAVHEGLAAAGGGHTAGPGHQYPSLMRYGPGTGPDMDPRFRYAAARFIDGVRARAASGGQSAGPP